MSNKTYSQATRDGGNLLPNLLHFTQLLRRLGIPISNDQVSGLASGLCLIDMTCREDFYNTSRTFLLNDISKKGKFDFAFDWFWSKFVRVVLQYPVMQHADVQQETDSHGSEYPSQDIRNTFLETLEYLPSEPVDPDQADPSIKPLYSSTEILRNKDFSNLSREELQQARKIIRELNWSLEQRRSRRKFHTVKKTNYIDFRRSIRNSMRMDSEFVDLEWRRKLHKPRRLIVICDISGSMERYSRIFLYFLYALVQETRQFEAFVFGTRLTRLTTHLRKKDFDLVSEDLSTHIRDWSGGTRIGEAMKDFNFIWSRRVGCQGAIVMIISDGWDRGNYELLQKEIGRLSRTAHKLIWLNPLADAHDYQPLVKGIQTILPYVDGFYPLANLNNFESLSSQITSI